MKRLGNPTFFRTFDHLVSQGNPGVKLNKWVRDGVSWTKERHAYQGARHGFTIEIFTGVMPGRQGWSLKIIKEYWWLGDEAKSAKNRQWAHQDGGKRSDLMAWLKLQEQALRLN